MATIEKRKASNGEISYRCAIRKKGIEIYKTFLTEEDAKLYAFYKERLIDNMTAFEVGIKDRITLRQIFELKIQKLKSSDAKSISDHNVSLEKISKFMDVDKFVCDLTFDDWLEACKKVFNEPVFRGSKAEHNKRAMSPITLRRVFAVISSAISNAIALGIPIENHALKVMQTHINPMIKEGSTF